MKPTLKVSGTKRLKLKDDKLLSTLLQFCFQIQLAPLQHGHPALPTAAPGHHHGRRCQVPHRMITTVSRRFFLQLRYVLLF
jgi:hypothetical protein